MLQSLQEEVSSTSTQQLPNLEKDTSQKRNMALFSSENMLYGRNLLLCSEVGQVYEIDTRLLNLIRTTQYMFLIASPISQFSLTSHKGEIVWCGWGMRLWKARAQQDTDQDGQTTVGRGCFSGLELG